jgi:hypothetical protein
MTKLDLLLASATIESRPYQARLVEKTVSLFGRGITSVLVNAPTGSGKTIIALLVAKLLQEQYGCGVGWVAMRRNLLQQAAQMNLHSGIHCDGIRFISMFEQHPLTLDHQGRPIEILIVDECLPLDARVEAEENGIRLTLTMGEILAGRGDRVLSQSASVPEYQPIISRTDMGLKELWEVRLDVAGEQRTLLITGEGRISTENGYLKPRQLFPGQVVHCLASCPSVATVQVPAFPPDLATTGIILSVRNTGRVVQTADIGVAVNANFYADGVLVHNCHHDACNTMANLHNLIQPRLVCGLTATAYRTDKVRLCFQKVIRDIGIHQLVESGFLSPYHHYIIPNWDPETVSNTYLREPCRWGKSVIYFHHRQQAEECCQRLQAGGVRATTVFGDHPFTQREQVLDDFERDKLDVLVNMMLLTEGYDCASLKTVFVRDSNKAVTIQCAGRVFRKHPDLTYKQVVQSKNTHFPLTREVGTQQSFAWQADSWRSYHRSAAIERVSFRSAVAMAQISTALPPYIQKKLAVRHFRQRQRSQRATRP